MLGSVDGKSEKSDNELMQELCKYYLGLCKRTNKRNCINHLEVLESLYSALKQFTSKYEIIKAMWQKLRIDAEQKVFS